MVCGATKKADVVEVSSIAVQDQLAKEKEELTKGWAELKEAQASLAAQQRKLEVAREELQRERAHLAEEREALEIERDRLHRSGGGDSWSYDKDRNSLLEGLQKGRSENALSRKAFTRDEAVAQALESAPEKSRQRNAKRFSIETSSSSVSVENSDSKGRSNGQRRGSLVMFRDAVAGFARGGGARNKPGLDRAATTPNIR